MRGARIKVKHSDARNAAKKKKNRRAFLFPAAPTTVASSAVMCPATLRMERASIVDSVVLELISKP